MQEELIACITFIFGVKLNMDGLSDCLLWVKFSIKCIKKKKKASYMVIPLEGELKFLELQQFCDCLDMEYIECP